MDRTVSTFSGELPEEWIMGPWMREDLESVSGGEPGLFGELVPELKEWLESDDAGKIRERLKVGADRRWEAKESMARCLVDTAGWEGALHRLVLYTIGFPYNRRPFFELADAYPREAWMDDSIVEEIRSQCDNEIRWGLGRPANQAKVRLRQYQQLNNKSQRWPALLSMPPNSLLSAVEMSLASGIMSTGTRGIRRISRFPQWRTWLEACVLAACLTRSLSDRLWIDAFLPVMVVAGKLPRESACVLWQHWQAATYPDCYPDLLKLANIQIDRLYPMSNGWVQGMFWLEDQIRVEGVRRAMG
jgi:hypothetical protein